MNEQSDILDELKLMADMWDDNEDQEMSVFFVRCIGEIRKLREALHPFANHPEFHAPDEWAITVIDRAEPDGAPVAGVTAGDFRRAAAAMPPNTAKRARLERIVRAQPVRRRSKVADNREQVLDLITQYGGIDGAHHKQWLLDQIVRILTGDGYENWVAEYQDGEDGPETYEWDEGIAP